MRETTGAAFATAHLATAVTLRYAERCLLSAERRPVASLPNSADQLPNKRKGATA